LDGRRRGAEMDVATSMPMSAPPLDPEGMHLQSHHGGCGIGDFAAAAGCIDPRTGMPLPMMMDGGAGISDHGMGSQHGEEGLPPAGVEEGQGVGECDVVEGEGQVGTPQLGPVATGSMPGSLDPPAVGLLTPPGGSMGHHSLAGYEGHEGQEPHGQLPSGYYHQGLHHGGHGGDPAMGGLQQMPQMQQAFGHTGHEMGDPTMQPYQPYDPSAMATMQQLQGDPSQWGQYAEQEQYTEGAQIQAGHAGHAGGGAEGDPPPQGSYQPYHPGGVIEDDGRRRLRDSLSVRCHGAPGGAPMDPCFVNNELRKRKSLEGLAIGQGGENSEVSVDSPSLSLELPARSTPVTPPAVETERGGH